MFVEALRRACRDMQKSDITPAAVFRHVGLPGFSSYCVICLCGLVAAALTVFLVDGEDKRDAEHAHDDDIAPSEKHIGNAKSLAANHSLAAEDPVLQQDRTVTAIMDVLEAFSRHQMTDQFQGRLAFSPCVKRHVSAGRKIPMVLPAFPAKSINTVDKVLGPLPDFGEELALDRLNDLCTKIRNVYEHGAMVLIATDGVCYNDLTGVKEEDLWEYGVTIRRMIQSKGYTCIETVDTTSILGMHDGSEMTREKFISLLDPARRKLEREYGDPNFDANACIKNDPDYKMTFDGYAKFLKKDLAYGPIRSSVPSGKKYKAKVHDTAKAMIARGVAFAKLILDKYPEHVRLSIHPSTGRTKISIPLVPTEGHFSMTPWHSVIVADEYGNLNTAHVAGLRETHDLIYQHNRPYYFRTRSPLYNWEAKVEFEHLYGRGLIVHNAGGPQQTKSSLSDSDRDKLASLMILQRNVRLSGFL